jgi:hypothetical protein
MATIKMGATVSDARGSVGGTVFSRNTGGAYTRARVAPINRKTPAQSLVRSNFGLNSKMWSGTLTADQRAAWTLFAQSNPVPNRLGDSIILSGLAMFNKLNQVLAQILQPPLLDAPADLSVPALAPATGAVANTGTLLIGAVASDQTVVAGAGYYVEATGPLAAGRTPPSSAYRFMAEVDPVAMANTVPVTSEWTAKFGTLAAGVSIGIRVSQVNTATGALTPALVFWTIST